MTRVATVRDLDISASSCASKVRPSPNSLHHTSIPTSHFGRASASYATTLLPELPPHLCSAGQPSILKLGAAEIEFALSRRSTCWRR